MSINENDVISDTIKRQGPTTKGRIVWECVRQVPGFASDPDAERRLGVLLGCGRIDSGPGWDEKGNHISLVWSR